MIRSLPRSSLPRTITWLWGWPVLKWAPPPPAEPGAGVGLHLVHQVAGEATQVRDAVAILGRDDEAELVAVLAATFDECSPIRVIHIRPIEPAAIAVLVCAIALQVAQVGVGRPAAGREPHDPGLDHDAPHPLTGTALLRRV